MVLHRLTKSDPTHEMNANIRSNSIASIYIFRATLFLVAFAPLPLGSNRPLPVAILSCTTGVLLALWAVALNFDWVRLHPKTRNLKWAGILYTSVCIWILVQCAPFLPAELDDPIWQSATTLLKLNVSPSISVNPEASIEGLMHLLLYGGIFWLTFQSVQSQQRAISVIKIITLIGCSYALYGIIVYLTGNKWVLFYPKWSYYNSLTSSFVNRNSFATFAGLTLLCAMAMLLMHLTPYFALKHPIRSKIIIIVEEITARAAWITVSVLSITIAMLLSASRAGVGASMLALLVLLVLFLIHQKIRLRHFVVLLIFSAVTSFVFFSISGNLISKRLKTDQLEVGVDTRMNTYALTWGAIKTAPWYGTGFGTYADVFPAYRDSSDGYRWDKAHNTYLENALELGIPATVALNLAIALLAIRALIGSRERHKNSLVPTIGFAATLLVGAHALVDFSLQIPAVTMLYACIMGLAVSQSWSNKLGKRT